MVRCGTTSWNWPWYGGNAGNARQTRHEREEHRDVGRDAPWRPGVKAVPVARYGGFGLGNLDDQRALGSRDAVDLESVETDLTRVVHGVLEPIHVSLWTSQHPH